MSQLLYIATIALAVYSFGCDSGKSDEQKQIENLQSQVATLNNRIQENQEKQQAEQQQKDEQQRLVAEREQEQTAKQQLTEKLNNILVVVDDYDSDGIGHLFNINLKLDNPTDLQFNYVAIDVTYVKANKDVYKTERVYIYNVDPYSVRMQPAPESNRGVDLYASITDYQIKP
ncbi:hypothetical protein CLV58_1672 [Spirosoma oryzae]|uniref:Uncharacterized protein n=1 Tax=Spirosoma oryzae TaxID=1469603 RepID=A0A2T0RF21_9BACT|nr:hypothetical protein [Spirosoma oryzae]PRY19755.1 hypothetical protein CLV58_1672 [Spirosoma oryzae]